MPYICLANAFMGSCTTMQLPNLIDANEAIKAVEAIKAIKANDNSSLSFQLFMQNL